MRFSILSTVFIFSLIGCGPSVRVPDSTESAEKMIVPLETVRESDPEVPAIEAIPDERLVSKSTGMRFAVVPAGTYQVGSPHSELGRVEQEELSNVTFPEPYEIGTREVTQGEFRKIMGRNPSRFRPGNPELSQFKPEEIDQFPVECVTWFDAIEFCNKMSEADGLKPYYKLTVIIRDKTAEITAGKVTAIRGTGYRLPRDAEWECACRARTTTPFHFGTVSDGHQSNVDARVPHGATGTGINLDRTSAVGTYKPNAFGLYDMHGNVAEWCHAILQNPDLPQRDDFMVDGTQLCLLRGGCWNDSPSGSRSAAFDFMMPPGIRNIGWGFRVARSVEEQLESQ